MAPKEAEERKRKDRERKANKKLVETPEEAEERKRKARERYADQQAAKRIKTD
jgi:hypothetical protein